MSHCTGGGQAGGKGSRIHTDCFPYIYPSECAGCTLSHKTALPSSHCVPLSMPITCRVAIVMAYLLYLHVYVQELVRCSKAGDSKRVGEILTSHPSLVNGRDEDVCSTSTLCAYIYIVVLVVVMVNCKSSPICELYIGTQCDISAHTYI